ncbi:MAG: tetratricopeptide repeat protein [Gammaproteobacteria bacterium]|nr:tetratricopeptide repeat protein [Gammaproteobacteria bacterium]MDE0367527.1 tetratricopeptide repeat protein [Gammaproteobacteria bacterium]
MPKGSVSSQKPDQTRLGGYSTREVADLIGLKPSQVRHYVRREILDPQRGSSREYRFRFQDIVLLRTAKGLMDAGVSTRDIYRALTRLKTQLRSVPSLASVRIFAEGGNVVVSNDRQIWNVATGQGHFDFAVRELADNVADLANNHVAAAMETEELSSDEWYNLGVDLEEVDARKAPECYRRALKLDPGNADAHVNLGRLFQLEGEFKKARKHYGLALAVAGEHPLAHYNLGTVYDEHDEFEQAADHYRMAADVPDAHYNLARICRLQGDQVSAHRHMQIYWRLSGREEPADDR